MSSGRCDSLLLREERLFRGVLIASCVGAALFLVVFTLLTLIKSAQKPADITAAWFAAWGQWAGGLATAAAFLIAACSIIVTGAHARQDRRDAAEIRDNKDMAQARQLVVYKVNMPDGNSIQSLATFRVENRSEKPVFDVRVPFVDAPAGSMGRTERRTPELVEAEHRLHECLPIGESLTPYMSQSEDEFWFTLVTVHTADWKQVKFAVEYTDAVGLRWRQHYGGDIERILTKEAIPVRDADRFQPPHQIRTIPDDEKRKIGGPFARNLPPLEGDALLNFLGGAAFLAKWKRVERVGQPQATEQPSSGSESHELRLEIFYAEAGAPMWHDYLGQKLSESGFGQRGGSSGGPVRSTTLECTEADIPRVIDAFEDAIEYANDQFEANELAAARRVVESAEDAARKAADRQAYLDELTREFTRPGEVPWQRRAARGHSDYSGRDSAP
jgi:hypothetical protein